MKKFFFLAAIALVASAACTKNEVKSVDDQAIAFTVGNYVPQTKTDLPAPAKFTEYTSFTTDAWFHPADNGTAQAFMTGETVKLQNNPDSNNSSTDSYWAPDRTYFWPKTGYINFYSQAGSPAATITDGSASYGTSGSLVAITDTTSNPVLASAAYHYSRTQYNNNSYAFTYGDDNTNVTGVPTLFHHMLAKVKFVIKFDATDGSAKDKWTLTVNSAVLHYVKDGYLTVNFETNKPAAGTPGLSWPWTANEVVGWSHGTTDAALAANNMPKAQTQAGIDGGTTSSVNAGRVLFEEVSVLPQDLTAATGTGAKLSLNYTLTHYYNTATGSDPANWVAQITETVNLTDAVDANSNPALGSIKLTDFTSSDYDNWYMNHKYIYTITIKPDHKITFSPAVIPWVESNSTGYTYPED